MPRVPRWEWFLRSTHSLLDLFDPVLSSHGLSCLSNELQCGQSRTIGGACLSRSGDIGVKKTRNLPSSLHQETKLAEGSVGFLPGEVQQSGVQECQARCFSHWIWRSRNWRPFSPLPVMYLAVWEIETLVRVAQCIPPDPGNSPTNRLFIPDSVCSQALQWAHSSKLTCHPRVWRTLMFVHQHF